MHLCDTCGTNEAKILSDNGEGFNVCALCYADTVAHSGCYDTMTQCCDAVCDALRMDVVDDAMRDIITLYYYVDENGFSRHI